MSGHHRTGYFSLTRFLSLPHAICLSLRPSSVSSRPRAITLAFSVPSGSSPQKGRLVQKKTPTMN